MVSNNSESIYSGLTEELSLYFDPLHIIQIKFSKTWQYIGKRNFESNGENIIKSLTENIIKSLTEKNSYPILTIDLTQ